MTRGAWRVERWRAPAAALHERALPDPLVRTVWVLEPTDRALVLGSAQPASSIDPEACARAGVAVVRRRSGGGAVLVAPGRQLWLDVLLPVDDPLWDHDVGRAFGWIGATWAAALADLGVRARVHDGPMRSTPWSPLVCFAGLGPGEVIDAQGAKLVGLSQRRTRPGARFQCAALSSWAPEEVVDLLALDDEAKASALADVAPVARGLGDALPALGPAFLAHLPA